MHRLQTKVLQKLYSNVCAIAAVEADYDWDSSSGRRNNLTKSA